MTKQASTKFKVGDRVVVLDGLKSQKNMIGKTIVIKAIEEHDYDKTLYFNDNERLGYYEFELESEDVHNSPLNLALK